jgi:hypothetical protein
VRFRVDSVIAPRGLVLARPIERGDMLATPRARLGGRRILHFELPRKLKPDGTPDLELIGFQLENPEDARHFPAGAVVEYVDE